AEPFGHAHTTLMTAIRPDQRAPCAHRIAERAFRLAPRFRLRHPLGHQLLRPQIEVQSDLLIQVALRLRAGRKRQPKQTTIRPARFHGALTPDPGRDGPRACTAPTPARPAPADAGPGASPSRTSPAGSSP